MPDLGPAVAAHGYWVLALVVLLENVGVPVPGETALLAAGYLSSGPGGHHLHLWAVVATAFPAAVVGDNLGFLLGRKLARPRLALGKGFLFLSPARMKSAESYFANHGLLTVFAARFVAGLRVVAGPAAGASGMLWPRFAAANAAGALAWASAVAVVGYSGGHAWAALREWTGTGAWVVVGVATVVLSGWWVARRRPKPRKT